MEAYSAPVGYVFSLNAGGRSGAFDVIAGDFSAELTADTENAIYAAMADDLTASTKVVKRRIENGVMASWWGVGDDSVSQDTAFSKFLDYILNNSCTSYLPNKKIELNSAHTKVVTVGVDLRGAGDSSEISVTGGNLISIIPAEQTYTLSTSPSKTDDSFLIPASATVVVGNVIFFSGSTESDTVYNVNGSDTAQVIRVDSGVAYLNKKFRFVPTTIKVYDAPNYFKLSNLRVFNRNPSDSITPVLRLRGYKNLFLSTVVGGGTYPRGGICPFEIYNSSGVFCKDVVAENCLYGILLSGGHNFVCRNIQGNHTRHPVSPTNWQDGVVIENLSGNYNTGIMDSHPSFDVFYRGVRTNSDTEASTLRCVGGGMEDIDVSSDNLDYPGGGPYIQSTKMNDGSNIFSGTSLVLKDVRWRSRLPPFIQYGGNLVCDNVEHTDLDGNKSMFRVGAGENVFDKVSIKNSSRSITSRQDENFFVDNDFIAPDDVSGVLEIKTNKFRLTCNDGYKVACKGSIFKNQSAATVTKTIKVYDNFLSSTRLISHLCGKITFNGSVRHFNTGTFDMLTESFDFYHRIIGTSRIYFLTTPSYKSADTGQTNESLSFAISNISQSGLSESFGQPWIQFDIELSSGRTNPIYSLDYELELFLVG
jgi:hypothetical protein